VGVVWFVDLFNYYTGGGDDGALSNKELQLETKVFYFDVGENPRGRFLRISEGSSAPGRPRGRTSLIIPSGGAGDTGWTSFRDTLVQIHEAQQMLPAPEGVIMDDMGGDANTSSFFSNGAMGMGGGASAGVARVVTTSSSSAAAGAGGPASITGAGSTQVMRAGNKRFFFDLGSNQRGSFLRITEVVGMDRTSVIVPAEALPQFYEAMGRVLNPSAPGAPGVAGVGVGVPAPGAMSVPMPAAIVPGAGEGTS